MEIMFRTILETQKKKNQVCFGLYIGLLFHSGAKSLTVLCAVCV